MKSFAFWTRPTGYVHTASFSDLQDGASSGCWEIYDPSAEPLILSPPISQSQSKRQKAVASVTAGAYQIRARFCVRLASGVVRRWFGWKPGTAFCREVSPGDSTAIPKLKRRNPVTYDIVFLWNVLILSNGVKAAWI